MILPTFGVWVRMKKHGRTRTGCMNLDLVLGELKRNLVVSQYLGYLLGVPIIKMIIFWVLYWGPPILGNYQLYIYTISPPNHQIAPVIPHH